MKTYKELRTIDESYKVGDEVLGKANAYTMYSGKIEKIEGTDIHLKHKDGTLHKYHVDNVLKEYPRNRPYRVREEVKEDTLIEASIGAFEAKDANGNHMRAHFFNRDGKVGSVIKTDNADHHPSKIFPTGKGGHVEAENHMKNVTSLMKNGKKKEAQEYLNKHGYHNWKPLAEETQQDLDEGWKKERANSQEKTNRDREGHSVTTPHGEGTVRSEHKIPTFSRSVPYSHHVLVKHSDGTTKMHAIKDVKFTKKEKMEEETMNESEAEMHADIVHHTTKPIAKYKALGGDEHFGNRLQSIGKMLAKKHGVPEAEMHKKVNAHVETHFPNESVSSLEEVNDYFKRRKNEEDIISGKKPAKKSKTPVPSNKEKDVSGYMRNTHTGRLESVGENMNETIPFPSFSEFIDENSPFDWKNKKSEIDWSGKKGEVKHTDTGLVHKAREGSRNAETGSHAEKKAVGRPAGSYGSYKIDKATRDDPEYKKNLSAKVRAAKAEGLAVRGEYKSHMDAAIKKRQLELAGIKEATTK